MTDELLRIGDVADRVGLSLRTVRYYEEQGLVSPRSRTQGGFRLYAEEQVARLALIKQMKPLGFTLDEMRGVLAARATLAEDAPTPEAVSVARAALTAYSDQAEQRLAKLRKQLEQSQGLADELRAEATGGPLVAQPGR